jgi:dipicolinate synthase subunit B
MAWENLAGARIGCAMTGSFCTFASVLDMLGTLRAAGAELYPILSFNASQLDTRFMRAEDLHARLKQISGREVMDSIVQVEPIGPKKLLDLVLVAPCTGNSMAKIANGISDTPVTLAVKSHLRNGRPVVIAPSTNDGLAGNAANIGRIMALRNMYIAPFGQDDANGKPTSLVAKWMLVPDACDAALAGRQIQPMLM